MTKKIEWICEDCGMKHKPKDRKPFTVSTWHYDICDVCGELKPCTQGRDYSIYEVKQ